MAEINKTEVNLAEIKYGKAYLGLMIAIAAMLSIILLLNISAAFKLNQARNRVNNAAGNRPLRQRFYNRLQNPNSQTPNTQQGQQQNTPAPTTQ